jgi:glycosyltransferase involved in cell wall biosynthesis
VNLVGWGATAAVEALAELPGVRLVGWVPEVEPWYAEADVAIIPIRAGGGTRIKALEAFAYRRPVVATTIGIEGIDAGADEHVFIGDTVEAFAAQCVRLMTEPELAERLTENAFALFNRAYTIEAVTATLAAGAETTCAASRPQRMTTRGIAERFED